jgi:hypothetical protein
MVDASEIETEPPAKTARSERRARGEELARQLAELMGHQSACERAILFLLPEFEDSGYWADEGARTCTAWLSWRLGMTLKTAQAWLRVARKLQELPLTDDSFRKGEISYSVVRAMSRVATPENEALFLQYARSSTGELMAKVCAHLRQQLAAIEHPDVASLLHLAFRPHDDGSVTLSVRMRADQAATVRKAVAVKVELDREQGAPKRDPSEARLDRVNAIVGICERFLETASKDLGRRIPGAFEALVTVDLATLMGTGPVPVDRCELADGTPISAEAARRICCDSPVVPALLKPNGDPVDVGRRKRALTKPLRWKLFIRDRGMCQFPGCHARGYLDAHHIQHWARGGATKLENLVLLCRDKHHVYVHEGGFKILVADDGALVFLDPRGEPIRHGSALPSLGDDAVERLMERHRAAGLEITPETNRTAYDATHRVDMNALVATLLDRTPGTHWFRPQEAFTASDVPRDVARARIREAPWFRDLPEEVQKRVG